MVYNYKCFFTNNKKFIYVDGFITTQRRRYKMTQHIKQIKRKLEHTKEQLEKTNRNLQRQNPKRENFIRVVLNTEKCIRDSDTEQLEHTTRTIINYKNAYSECINSKEHNLLQQLEMLTLYLYIYTTDNDYIPYKTNMLVTKP